MTNEETNEKKSDKQEKPAKKKRIWPRVVLWIFLTPVLLVLAAPYIPMDGVNEKGVFAALMDVDTVEIHDDTERPELLVSLAVRLILDRAASVDEALELLR